MDGLKYIGGEYADNELNDFYSNNNLLDIFFPKIVKGKSRCFFETGTDSLAAIFFESCEKNSDVNFFIPVNYCFETIERLKLKLSVYNIQLIVSVYNNLSEIDLQNQNIILINHFNSYSDVDIETIKLNSIIIEDFVHSPFEMSKFKGDYALNSFRKFANIEVSISYLSNERLNYENSISEYFQLKKEAQKNKSTFFETNNVEYEKSYLNGFTNANNKLFSRQVFLAQNSEIEKLRKIDIDKIINKRKNNYKILADLMLNIKEIKILNGLYMYFMIECLLRDDLKRYLAQKGIFTAIHWLDSNSEMSKKSLTFHIDHRYNVNDMKRIYSEVKNFYEGKYSDN